VKAAIIVSHEYFVRELIKRNSRFTGRSIVVEDVATDGASIGAQHLTIVKKKAGAERAYVSNSMEAKI